MNKPNKILVGCLVGLVVMISAVSWVGAQSQQRTFSPDREITRAEVVTMIWRAHGEQPSSISAEDVFADIDPDAYYAEALAWAYENGITFGTGFYDPLPERDWSFEVEDAIVKAAEAFSQDPQKLSAIAYCENRQGDPNVVSRTNDWGLFQHNKTPHGGNAVERFARFGFDFDSTWNDPYVNAYVAAAHADEVGSYQPWYPSRYCHGQRAL